MKALEIPANLSRRFSLHFPADYLRFPRRFHTKRTEILLVGERFRFVSVAVEGWKVL